MREIKIKSVIPIYVVAGVWLIWALFLPMYKLWHFLLAIAVTVAAWLIASRLCPGRRIQVEEPVQDTGDAQVDAILAEGRRAMGEMAKLRQQIPNTAVQEKIMQLIATTDKILRAVAEDPKDAALIRRFFSYYLPTTIKLLHTYDRMGAQGVAGANISGTMGKIEDMLDTAVQSFEKQLDALFADEALDIESDIAVMETMMQAEGLDKEN